MNALSLIDSAKLTSPNPVTLICSKTPSGVTNLATVSWWTYLSLEPETIGFAMMKTSYTGEMVRASKQVVLTVPGKRWQNRSCSAAAPRGGQKIRQKISVSNSKTFLTAISRFPSTASLPSDVRYVNLLMWVTTISTFAMWKIFMEMRMKIHYLHGKVIPK